jgi:hypothetical protein
MQAARIPPPVRIGWFIRDLRKAVRAVPGLAERLPPACDIIHQERQLVENKGGTKMKTLKAIILSVGAIAVLGASGLYAQNNATVEIPLEFTVRNPTLPAGEYTMQRMSATSGAMSMRSVETRKAIFVLAPSNVTELKAAEDNVVLFHRIGDHYFLAEVKNDGVCGHVGPPKLERELASEGSGQPMATAIVLALTVS